AASNRRPGARCPVWLGRIETFLIINEMERWSGGGSGRFSEAMSGFVRFSRIALYGMNRQGDAPPKGDLSGTVESTIVRNITSVECWPARRSFMNRSSFSFLSLVLMGVASVVASAGLAVAAAPAEDSWVRVDATRAELTAALGEDVQSIDYGR